MKLIVGLGNIGEKYENTRHNIGFMVIDALCKEFNINLNQNKFNSYFFKNDDFILLKPKTYMNLSGVAVEEVVKYFKIPLADILVICDDLDTPFGQAKIKLNGNSNGHNGIKNIIEKLNTNYFNRLKIGIGRPLKELNIPISNYVLSPFSEKENKIINKMMPLLIQAISNFIYNDIKIAMNNFNNKLKIPYQDNEEKIK